MVAVLLIAGWTWLGAVQTRQTLPSLIVLTAPPEALTEGCALERPTPDAGFPSNPWLGTDPDLTAVVRQALDGEMSGVSATQIREAYRATYVSAEGARTEVYAVTFRDASLARSEPPPGSNREKTLSARLVRGATLIKVVSAISPANWCFDAVQLHIGKLK